MQSLREFIRRVRSWAGWRRLAGERTFERL
jgi:hypothetical protein